MALAATQVESGRTWRHNEHLRLPSASLIKLPILAAFWETVAVGRLDPMERVHVSAETLRVEVTGELKALAPGLQPTWSDLATLMITVNDNVATNVIVDRLGMDAIQGGWTGRGCGSVAADLARAGGAAESGSDRAAASGRLARCKQDGRLRARGPRRWNSSGGRTGVWWSRC